MVFRTFLPALILFLTLPLFAEERPLQRHLPAHASLQGTVFLRLPDPLQRETLIRQAYERLAERMRAAGSDLAFTIDGLNTRFPHEFGRLRLADHVTVRGGWSLRWNYQRHFLNEELLGVSYRPEWYEARPWSSSPESLALLESTTVEEWLVRNASPRSDAREMITAAAITFYEVTASMDGRSRSYKAAVLWLPVQEWEQDGHSDVHVGFLDNVAPFLRTALSDSLPEPVPVAQLEARKLEAWRPSTLGKAIGSSCETTSESIAHSSSTVGTTNHKLGSHAAIAGVRADCSCDVSCQGRCVAQITRQECDDWGDIGNTHGWVHDISAPSADTADTIASNAIVQGPTCYGGVACAWKECFLSCLFEPTIAAGYSGVSFEVTYISPGAASLKKSINMSCAACVTADSDPTDPGGGGSLPTCPTPDSCSSPVLIHFGRGQPRLSKAGGGVRFDIDADGVLEQVAWPVSVTDTAFLAMDRNGNGQIDDATELFGDHTPDQVAGIHGPNGYEALAMLDSGSGSGGVAEGHLDGGIAADEAPYTQLLLWFDKNRDGLSQPEELEGLEERGIARLGYDYKLSHRRDSSGNVYRFRSDLLFADSQRQGHSFDVFLLKEEP